MSVRVAALVAAILGVGSWPDQHPASPTAAERVTFRASLVVVRDSSVLRWRPLRGATGYEVLSSSDGRRYGLEDLVTSNVYHLKPRSRTGRIWFRVVAVRSAKVLLDTTAAVLMTGEK